MLPSLWQLSQALAEPQVTNPPAPVPIIVIGITTSAGEPRCFCCLRSTEATAPEPGNSLWGERLHQQVSSAPRLTCQLIYLKSRGVKELA